MLRKPPACNGCPLFIDGKAFSRPEGTVNKNNGVLIVGESLGANEVLDGLPFRPWAEAGSALNRALMFLQNIYGSEYNRENFIYWNMIGCQPPFNNLENTPYEKDAIDHCQVHFKDVLRRFKPKVIVALGNVPLKHLWKKPQEVVDYIASLPEETKEDKKKKKRYLSNFLIGSMRGYPVESIYGIPLISSLHPSGVTQEKGRPQLGTLMRDIAAAVDIAKYGIPQFKTVYDEKPAEEKIKDFYNYCKDNPNLVISHDIETPMTALVLDESETEYENIEVRDIDSVQFSVKEGTGIFIPFYGDANIQFIKDILALPNPKIGWNNWKFDEINLEYQFGKDSIKGDVHDVMWMWKWQNQDFVKMGRALQFATNFFAPDFPLWKHLAQLEPENYGCLDVDATLRVYNGLVKNFTNPLFRFRSPLTGQIEDKTTKTVMQGYLDDIVYLREILEDMTKRGFPVDINEREKFKLQIEKEQVITLEELQDMYPMSLRKVTPELGYKYVPKEVLELTEEFKNRLDFKNKGLFSVFDSEDSYNFLLSKFIEKRTRPVDEETTGLVVKEFNVNGIKEKRYCKIKRFKPGSPQQVIAYIKFKGHTVPKVRDRIKGERDTTSKDQLQPLWEKTGDIFYYKCIYIRELDHLLSTYVENVGRGGKKKGWILGSDNRVHADFLYIPATGQLSTNPNIQNAPARGTKYSSKGYGEIAKQFRRMIVPKAGHSLLSADWSAFHINTLAFEAEDKDYMRIGQIDPHSFLGAEIILSKLQDNFLVGLKMRKPSSSTQEAWIKRVALYEEAEDRLKSFSGWLQLEDNQLKDQLKWWKTNFSMTRNSQAKPAILGMGFGMGVGKFFSMNKHTFKNKNQPEKILTIMKSRFPKTFTEYPEAIKKLADSQTYLISRYGYIRRFYDVYDWRLLKEPRPPKVGEEVIRTKRGDYWLRKDGQSANEAIAYLPSNDAFGKKKEAMRDLWNHPNGNLIKAYGLINEIHDDLTFEIEDGLINEAIPIIQNVMESPARFLKNSICPDGLVTKVEIKVGKNWADMQEIK